MDAEEYLLSEDHLLLTLVSVLKEIQWADCRVKLQLMSCQILFLRLFMFLRIIFAKSDLPEKRSQKCVGRKSNFLYVYICVCMYVCVFACMHNWGWDGVSYKYLILSTHSVLFCQPLLLIYSDFLGNC